MVGLLITMSNKKKIYSSAVFTLFFGLLNISIAAKQLPVEAKLLWEREYFYVAPCDIDRDSIDELVIIQNNSDIQPRDQNLYTLIANRILEDGTFKPNTSRCGGINWCRTMWATFIRRDSIFLLDVWPRREIFVTSGNDISKPVGWDGWASQVEVSDINADGILEAVVLVNVESDLKPRGIFVVNWTTGKVLWKFLCGPNIDRFILKDIDNDGKQEILCGTIASGNGNIGNGTDDAHSYVYILNSDGSLRWRRPIGVYCSKAKAQFLYRSKVNQLLVCVNEIGCPVGGRKYDSIFLLDAQTGKLITKTQYGKFNGGCVVVNDRRGDPLIFIGGSDDTLRVLNENLKLIRKCFINGGGCLHMTAENFAGGDENEAVINTTSGQIMLYDLQLNLLTHFSIGEIYQMVSVANRDKSRLLIQLERPNRAIWQLVEFNRVPLLNRNVTIASVLGGVLILIIFFIILLLIIRYRQVHDIRLVIRGLTGQAGVVEINRNGEVVNINPHGHEILGIDNDTVGYNLDKLSKIKALEPVVETAKSVLLESTAQATQEMVVSLSHGQTYLVRCVRVKTGIVLTFEDISKVEYLQRVMSWTLVAQKLAHGIKNPLSTILGAVEQMEIKFANPGIQKYTGYVKDEVFKLKRIADAFMKFTKFSVPVLESANINECVASIMRRYETTVSAGIKIEYELDKTLPMVNFDYNGVANVLNIVIENAIEAMNNRGVLKVKTMLAERKVNTLAKKYVRIEISDTGVGIPEEYLGKLFEPYFTYNKPMGTGLGLPLAKKIIEDHKGMIEISSTVNVGTQVNIYLPLKQENKPNKVNKKERG
jgi:nitrogen-specific signal transduction histidine kinase